LRLGLAPVEPGEIGQHGVGADDAVSAEALGGIERLIRLSEQPVRAGIVAGNERRHADTERHMRAGLRQPMR
jgi:hypothetical protein